MKKIEKQFPLVVIFGRTNVGKSTLFNKLIEQNNALVSDIEGTTRDCNISEVSWGGKKFTLVDTGGIMNINNLLKKTSEKKLPLKILENIDDIDTIVQIRSRDYLKQADLILFLVDTKTGLLPDDKKMALILKKIIPLQKNILLVANKADSPRLISETAEFNKLSLGDPLPVSAATGSGTGDLLDKIVNNLSPLYKNAINHKSEIKNFINVCILGQPNVGKSSLINSILGEKRIIVSSVPHTTREPKDIELEYKNSIINLIDTAGISKQGQKGARVVKERETLEKKGIAKSLGALKKADIALLVIDIKTGITHQDAKLVEEIINRRVSLIIIANKWDLIEERNTKKYTEYIYDNLPFVKWAPIQFTSALTGEKTLKILDLVLEIREQRRMKVADSGLENFLKRIIKSHKPPKRKLDKRPHIFELKQVKIDPPKFYLRIRNKDEIAFSYVKFIENRIRAQFGFLGTPINIEVAKRSIIKDKK